MGERKLFFITYTSDTEVIVITLNQEKKMLKVFFKEGERDLENYYRAEIYDFAVVVRPQLIVDF